jgi:hypothetical protein
MISLKGFRKITVDGKEYYYKCKSHEKTVVYIPDSYKSDSHKKIPTADRIFYLTAANSGEVNKMSLPSVVSEGIRERNKLK